MRPRCRFIAFLQVKTQTGSTGIGRDLFAFHLSHDPNQKVCNFLRSCVTFAEFGKTLSPRRPNHNLIMVWLRPAKDSSTVAIPESQFSTDTFAGGVASALPATPDLHLCRAAAIQLRLRLELNEVWPIQFKKACHMILSKCFRVATPPARVWESARRNSPEGHELPDPPLGRP